MDDIRGSYESGHCKNNDALKAFDHKIKNIAASLSIEMRNADDDVWLNGTAWPNEPRIKVSYIWLLTPVVLYAGITILFFTTVFVTRKTPPWKSSALALPRSTDLNNRLLSPKQFKEYTVSTEMRLEDNGETWHLLETARQNGDGK
ncbi:hypothetical protein K504DRAFT_455026 [Pleomassaria siparia CBS 279.74]|uniref:Uncharacterized protein n=1 Tax=Pleomassaria siparia CBS 279.74 TaxID=1314801 RepID=A0A6G1KA10_9PLEO|nr:hypothetical protein K504DRAFT_455026 [Pleomassaria siparia CBS 279.74]